MRYFSHFMIAIVLLALIVFGFFLFSIRIKKNVAFTDSEGKTAPTVTVIDPALGSADALVTLIEFGDYGCETCVTMEKALLQVRADFGDKVRIVWKDMPNTSLHAEAINAAVAARCAGEQGKFWDYHTALFVNQATLGSSLYTALAAQLSLNVDTFSLCLSTKETLPLVQKTFDEGSALGVTSTPTLYINDLKYTGKADATAIESLIRSQVPRM